MPRLLVIQPDASDPVGPLGEWFAEAGAELDVRLPPIDALPADLAGYQGLVCLGGGMNAEDDTRYPWLADVRRLLREAVGANLPTLGVCLGAQLLTVATGGKVAPGQDGPEAGASLVAKKDAAWKDPLFADLPLMQDVLQFHQDVIDRLPVRAELLASSPRYPNQAYRYGRCGYALQFHIETTPDVVREWVKSAPDVAASASEGAFTDERLAEAHADIAETWQPFAERFVRLAAGDIEPATDQPHTLPLV
ncbi:glutamine amidotransferase [Prauserella marina]|uniref:GMP synthase-Glutamine amidotransferase n=1 Tax=Prauserella marina TaxID=530584 RepID=A0A222VYE0_9PSEU|nr:type 1 glutamine amidotransferase [Prauserella marina]ASR38959.1 glutamine amidotransferase [Prauserella marina]PWV70951.1 GMP synthase-like glutamine amidotransferase [Prauserella marina]SDE00892.1 GMP synthase-Glutamine amidotransferase [Prauserella marina]